MPADAIDIFTREPRKAPHPNRLRCGDCDNSLLSFNMDDGTLECAECGDPLITFDPRLIAVIERELSRR